MRTLLVVIALGAVACSSSVSDTSLPCDTDLQCPAGTFCQMGTCAALPASHAVTIDAPNPVTAGKTLQLVAHAVGAVTWSVQEATGGTVDATGLYHAPAIPGTYHVVATSIADATQSATVAVTVVAPAVATITAPQFVTLGKGGYTASVPAQSGATYAWTITGGTISAGANTASITFAAGSALSAPVALSVTVTDSAGDSAVGSFSSTIVAAVAEPVLAGDSLTNGAARINVAAGAHVVEPPGGLTYSWSIVGGTFSGSSTGSTATGTSVTYQGSQEGSLTLTCVATSQSGDTATNTLSVTLVGAAVATSTVTATAGNTAVANGTSSIALTVALVDGNDNPVFADAITIAASPSSGVAFSGPAGTVNGDGSLGAVTGDDGTYSFAMTSTTAGTITVMVAVDGTQLSTAVVFVSGEAAAATSTLSANRTSTVANGTDAITFTATILDAFGNPVFGEPVQFKNGNSNLGAAVSTDALGHASYPFTSTAAVAYTITAVAGPGSANTFPLALPGSGLVVFVAGDADPGHTTVTPASGATGVADNSTPTSFSLKAADAFGNAAPNIAIAVSTTGSNNTLAPASGQTNAGGIFTWALTTKTAEQKNLTITVAQPLAQKSFQLTSTAIFSAGAPAQAQSSIASSASSITASSGASAATLTVTVRDQFSNLAGGATVQFSSSGSNNSFTNNGAATSAANGTASSALSSTTAESKNVSARVCSDAACATPLFTLALATPIVVGPAAASASKSTLVASTLLPVTGADNASTIGYTATVEDAFGNLVPGLQVAAAATGSSNTLSPSSGATDASGVFTFSLKTTKAEQKTVSISDTTSTPPDVLQQVVSTFVGGAPTTAALSASPLTVGADGVATSTLTVTAHDQNGNLATLSAGAVALSLQSGTVQSSSLSFAAATGPSATTSSGVYSTTVAASTTGSAVIGGSVGSIALAPVTITFVPGDASGTTTSITSSLDPITADGATTTTITLQVEDGLGHLIPNLAGIGLTVGGSGNTFSFAGPGTTDANGKITATLEHGGRGARPSPPPSRRRSPAPR